MMNQEQTSKLISQAAQSTAKRVIEGPWGFLFGAIANDGEAIIDSVKAVEEAQKENNE